MVATRKKTVTPATTIQPENENMTTNHAVTPATADELFDAAMAAHDDSLGAVSPEITTEVPEGDSMAAIAEHTQTVSRVNSYTIDNDIPIPGNAREARYPWAELPVGGSFFVAGGKQATFNTSCNKAGHKFGRAFIVRKWTEGKTEGVRIWRKA